MVNINRTTQQVPRISEQKTQSFLDHIFQDLGTRVTDSLEYLGVYRVDGGPRERFNMKVYFELC